MLDGAVPASNDRGRVLTEPGDSDGPGGVRNTDRNAATEATPRALELGPGDPRKDSGLVPGLLGCLPQGSPARFDPDGRESANRERAP